MALRFTTYLHAGSRCRARIQKPTLSSSISSFFLNRQTSLQIAVQPPDIEH